MTRQTRTPVVVDAVRTPVGREGGALSAVRSEDLSVPLVASLLDRTGLQPEAVEDLLWGCAQQRGEQGNNLARVVALLSPLGEAVPAATVNRWCGSSAEALMRAADAVAAGRREILLAGGVESMSRVTMGDNADALHPDLAERYNLGALSMGQTAETVAERYGIGRREQDEYALRSQERAAAAADAGRFDDELVPIETPAGTVAADEGIRPETTLDALAGLDPAFRSDGTVTAGNAAGIADGAAAVLVTSHRVAQERGLDPLAAVGDHAVAGVDPTEMGVGPVPAVRSLSAETFDLVELNEAFASQALYCERELGLDGDRVNVNGGAIALGHPLGASGARLPVTLVHEMNRRGADRGLATECIGFGQGAAIEFRAA
jgi:acetyl-CoA acetyltransferase family protein